MITYLKHIRNLATTQHTRTTRVSPRPKAIPTNKFESSTSLSKASAASLAAAATASWDSAAEDSFLDESERKEPKTQFLKPIGHKKITKTQTLIKQCTSHSEIAEHTEPRYTLRQRTL